MKTAVVIGSGIAGLVSAQVLKNHFDRVEVYGDFRNPQENHLHVLLKSGQESLEKLFPGITTKLIENGCPIIDWAQDTLWETHSGQFPRYNSSVKALSMSRILLSRLMRSYLNDPRVEFKQNRIVDLSSVKADFIVLAAGQNFPLHRFLGGAVLKEEIQDINLTYRSFIFKSDDLLLQQGEQYYFQINPPSSKLGGVISPMEGGRAMVTLIEQEERFTQCKTFEDFLSKADKVGNGRFKRIIGQAVPISHLQEFRKQKTHRRSLAVNKMPENLIVLGDALLSMNPVFGQGMSVALKEGEVLKSFLEEGDLDSRKIQKAMEKVIFFPHNLSSLGSSSTGIKNKFLQVYLENCQRFPTLHHFFLRQLHSMQFIPKSFL